MFAMNSVYTIENLLAGVGANSSANNGISLSFTLSTNLVPSDFSITLSNAHNKMDFRWNPFRMTSHISSYIVNDGSYDPSAAGQGSWEGKQISQDLLPPYEDVRVTFEIRGTFARILTKVGTQVKEVSVDFPKDPNNDDRNVKGWQVGVSSIPVRGVPSNTTITKYTVTADGSSAGSVTIEHITLTATDVANKYVEISDSYATEVAVNIAQATSQRQGVDFIMLGNKLSWGGYGLDIPAMKEGITIRVVYYSGTFGTPFYLKVGKRLVGVGGHGDIDV